MKMKKILAAGLAATMVLGSTVTAFAEDEPTSATIGGAGSLEGVVETDVMHVVLPTTSGTALSYIADPQGLIAKTDKAHYAEKTFGEGTLFFKNAEGAEFDYSNKSDALTVVNKSSMPIQVTISATATAKDTGSSNATVAESTDLSEENPEVYLAITDNTATKVLKSEASTITQVLGEAPADAYEYKYSGSAYSYDIKSDVSAFKFAEYSVYLTGEASQNGWVADTTLPDISVVWNVAAATVSEDNPITVPTPDQTPVVTSYVSATEVSSSSHALTLNLPESVTIASVTVNKKTDGQQLVLTEGTTYTVSGTTLDITAPLVLQNQVGGTIVVKYSDDHEDTLDIVL